MAQEMSTAISANLPSHSHGIHGIHVGVMAVASKVTFAGRTGNGNGNPVGCRL